MILNYSNVASSNTSRLEAHAGFFRLLITGMFDHYLANPHRFDFLISNDR